MEILKIRNYKDVENIQKYLENNFIVDLEDCDIAVKGRVMDFLSGLLYLNGTLVKINKNQFIVEGLKDLYSKTCIDE